MKKRLLILLFLAMLCLSGCQSEEEAQKEKIEKVFEEMGIEHDTVVMNVLSKEWIVSGSKEVYLFTKEGTGDISGAGFSYTCGFDEDNQIALQIIMDESEETRNYYVTMDDTGYGLYLDPVGDGEEVYLIQADVEILEITDERASGLVGEWADKSDNRYILREDNTMLIKSSTGDTEGTYSAVVREDGMILTLLFGSNTLEFSYDFLDDGATMQLCAPGTDVVHTWIKK